MYYEIYHKGNLIKRGSEDLLSTIEWDNELMYTPNMSLTFPATYLDYLHEFGEMKIFVNDKVFWGLIVDIDVDKAEETVDISLDHIIKEWEFREISVNNAIKEKNINIIYKEKKTETVTTTEKSRLNKAIEWYRSKMGKTTYSMQNRGGPNSYDCSSALYSSLVYAGVFKKGQMGTTYTLENDLKAAGWKRTDSPVRGDVFVFKAGEGGHQYGHTGMFIGKVQIIHMNGAANGISVNKFSYPWARIYHDPKNDGNTSVTKKTKTTLEDIDPKVVDQLDNIYEDDNFAYPGWDINYSKKAQNTKIDYVYSRQNKLEALTQTCELTDDLFWRVRFVNEKVLDISEFGDKKPYMLSTKPTGIRNIRIITEPTVDYDFESVINVASVYSAKSDTGMSALTLREVYEDESLQIDGFPVIILKPNVNNERDYSKYIKQPKAIAPNNELEFAVLDLEGIAEAGGYLVESSFAFNDISPFAVDQENGKTTKITDKDRVAAAVQAYKAAIKKLKQARAKYSLEIETEQLPADLNVGDKVRLIYNNELFIMESCSNYMKKILSYDDYFYITKIEYSIDETGGEVDTVTLEKELRIERETNDK